MDADRREGLELEKNRGAACTGRPIGSDHGMGSELLFEESVPYGRH